MRKRYWLPVSIALALAAAVAAVLVSIGGAAPSGNRGRYSGSAGPGFAPATLAILSRPATPLDALAGGALGPAASNVSNLNAARLAAIDGTQRIFVAPGRNETDCLIVIDAADKSTTVDCADTSTLVSGAIYISIPNSAARTEDIVGIVSDGVWQVVASDGQVGSVKHNVFTLHQVRGQTVTLSNSAGAKSVVDLGSQFLEPK